MTATTFQEQQKTYGFNTTGIEQIRIAASRSATHDSFVAMLKRMARPTSAAHDGAVTMLQDDGTVKEVSVKAAMSGVNDILADMAKWKSHRPCHSCGTHSCPPGSHDLCLASTAEPVPNTMDASVLTQIALDTWIAQHDLDPYTLYLEDGSPVLNLKHSGPCYDSRGFLLLHLTDPVEFMRAARQYAL